MNQSPPSLGVFLVECFELSIVDLCTQSGVDFILIDLEHGICEESRLKTLIQYANAHGVEPWVRVATYERGTISRILDNGAKAILFSQVYGMDEIEKIVKLTKYPPTGARGMHRYRPHTGFKIPDDIPAFSKQSNESVKTGVMIETHEAYQNLDEITATDGIDFVFYGPSDMKVQTAKLGLQEEDYEKMKLKMVESAKTAGKSAATLEMNAEKIAELKGWGYEHIVFGTAFRFLQEMMNNELQKIRSKVN